MKRITRMIALMLVGLLSFSMCPVYAAVPTGGTTLITTEQFIQNAVANTSGITAKTVTDGTGLYSRYISLDVTSITSSGASRALNYYDEDGKLGLKGNIATGDVLLVRVVARAANADGSDGVLYTALHDDSGTSASSSKVYFTNVWTEIYIPIQAKHNAFCFNLRVGSKIQKLDIAELELYNYKSTKTVEALPSTITKLETEGENQNMINFFDGLTGAESHTSLPQYPTSKKITEQTYTFTSAQTNDIATSDLIVCHLVVRADKSTALTLNFDKYSDKSMTYYVPAQWTEIRVLLEGRGLKKVTMTAENEIEIAGAWLIDHDAADSLTVGQQTGMYLLEDYDYYPLSEQGTGTGKSIDLVKNGNYIYSIGDGKFSVTDVSATPIVTDTIDGLGANIRQIAMTEDGRHVMVTSRENGAYIINVEDPRNVYVRTVYHSVEMATGIAISGDYAFVCNRHYGVEIVDISDLDHPTQVSVVRAGEVQSCKVKDNILYCGVWGTRSVEMYDISDPNLPTWLGSASLNGRGDGMAVITKGDKTYLYAATGHHTWGVSTSAPLTNLYYGQGNGLDIFDVTDPTNPIHLSTTKIDGRYYYANYDYWEAEVAESEDGHLYAYLVNTFNGVYVFNVDDPAAPKRVAKVDIPIATNSSNYKYYSSTSRAYVFPYDQTESGRSPVGACVVEDGKMYLAGVLTDLHILEQADILFEQEQALPVTPDVSPNGTYFTYDGSDLAGYRLFDSVGQINSVRQCGDRYFLAAGSEGIIEINEDMQRLSTTATEGICFDVAIYGDTLYAAEGDNGVSAYRIESKGLTQLWNYPSVNGTVRSLVLSPKGRFIVFQAGARYGEIISTETQKNVVNYHSGSQMYYRNVSPLIGGRYIFIWGFSSGGGKWYDFGTEDNYDKPVLLRTLASPGIGIHSGHIAEYDGKALSFATNGYIIYDPATTEDVSSLTAYTTDQEEKFSGFAAIKGDLMIVTDRPYRKLHITDISDITQPKILKTLQLPGNPDQALITDKYVWVPVGYQGLMRFDIEWKNQCEHIAAQEPVTDTAPTCTASGLGHSVCTICGATLQSHLLIPATAYHSAGEVIVDRAATCGTDGVGHTECTGCGKTMTQNISLTATGEHTDGSLVTDVSATCTKSGVGHKNCVVCGMTVQQNIEIPAISHTPSDWQTVTAATYLKEGLEKQYCTVCGKELNSRIIPTLQGTDVAKVFTDIKTTDWFYKNDSIYYVYNAGLFKGMTETEFKPATAMNRGMFVTVLGRLHGVNADNIAYKNTFSDMADGKYYSRYVIWAADNGIVTGTSATTFAPSKNVTREQICAMMVRYCNYAGIELKAENAAINFSDAGSISNYAKTAVTTCQRAGLVSGKGDNRFDPKGNAKRSEVATILLNFAKNYK